MNGSAFLETPVVPTTEDGFRRRVSYLRVSLTDRCNLKCVYCMPTGAAPVAPADHLLTTPELLRLLSVFRSLGVTKVRLTGGEPLLRADLETVLSHVTDLGIGDVSLTTNGLSLAARLPSLVKAGLRRVNVSLDTFRADRFVAIAHAGGPDRVLAGVRAALDAGLDPVKINMVVMRGWNFDEIPDFVAFARAETVHVRFLELMPTRNTFEGTAQIGPEAFVPTEEIRGVVERIAELGEEDPVSGVARTYPIAGGRGRIGFVSPVSNHFCGSCNRIRLTATGGLKTCLHGEAVVDLRSALRKGAADGEIADLVRNALLVKPLEHFIRPDAYVSRSLRMSQVGG